MSLDATSEYYGIVTPDMSKEKQIVIPFHKSVSRYLKGEVPTVGSRTTVLEAMALLNKKVKSFEDINYLYVLTKEKKLAGMVPLAGLLAASSKSNTLMQDLMFKDFPTIRPHTHQELAVKIALESNLTSLPIVDKNGIFVGALTQKEILSILREEHVEDLLQFSGIYTEQPLIDVFKAKAGNLIKLRLPWLILGLAGGMLATYIVQLFEVTLQNELTLVFFIPVIVYMSGAVNVQTQTLFIRGLALEKINIRKYLAREIIIGFIIGLVSSTLIALYALTLFQSATIALIVGVAMLAGVTSSVIIAVLIPWLLMRFGKDPAVGSGPFSTIIQDILSIVIYLTTALIILS